MRVEEIVQIKQNSKCREYIGQGITIIILYILQIASVAYYNHAVCIATINFSP